MLQFIVLGIVPGTSIQLTFADVMIGGLVLTTIPMLYWNIAGNRIRKSAKRIAAIQLISL